MMWPSWNFLCYFMESFRKTDFTIWKNSEIYPKFWNSFWQKFQQKLHNFNNKNMWKLLYQKHWSSKAIKAFLLKSDKAFSHSRTVNASFTNACKFFSQEVCKAASKAQKSRLETSKARPEAWKTEKLREIEKAYISSSDCSRICFTFLLNWFVICQKHGNFSSEA